VDELTAKELKLLQVFHAHAGEVLSRDKLLNEVWGYNYYGTTRTLDQVIVQLRKNSATTQRTQTSPDHPRCRLQAGGLNPNSEVTKNRLQYE